MSTFTSDSGSWLPGPLASRRNRILIAAGVTGALTLIEPRDLGPWQRAAYRTAVAVGSGLLAADLAHEDEPIMDPAKDGLLMGGLTMGLMDLTEHLDGKIVDGLRGVGVDRPRLLLAAVNALATAGLYAVAPSADGWMAVAEDVEESEPVELSLPVRRLIELLLDGPEDGTDLPGAATLREQLVGARTQDMGYPTADVQLIVDDPERLVVPHHQSWPVTGAFERDGVGYTVELMVADGMLAMLSVGVDDELFADADGEVDEEKYEAALDSLDSTDFRWPRPEEISVRMQTEQPV